MALVEYKLDDKVALVTMNSGENRFNPDFINEYLGVLDRIENDTDALSMVVTSGHEKIFSNGIDLDWLLPFIQQKNVAVSKEFFYLLNKLFRRTLTFPLITIAAMNGHAFAGGAIWACSFDFRFMRSDRGFFLFSRGRSGDPVPAGNDQSSPESHSQPDYGGDGLHRDPPDRGTMYGASYCQRSMA